MDVSTTSRLGHYFQILRKSPYAPLGQKSLLLRSEAEDQTHPESASVHELLPVSTTNSADHTDNEVSSMIGLESDSLHQQPYTRHWKDLADTWWPFEILALTLALTCFVALVLVLGASDGNRQQRWFSERLTLNSLVAFLTTFIRAFMMVSVAAAIGQLKWSRYLGNDTPRRLQELDTWDEASRGPYGSAKLMLSGAWLSLGTIGAVITTSTLALDTFSQQVITLEPELVPAENGTSAPELSRSNMYSSYSKEGQANFFVPDFTTKAAVYSGLFDYSSVVPPTAQCSTGNCTWPITPSLAVCGTCTNVTAAVKSTCVSIPGTSNCTYTVHDGEGYSFWMANSQVGSPLLIVDQFVSSHYNDSRTRYLAQFIEVDIAENLYITVRACALWFCVQAYNTSVRNGIQSQEIIGNASQTDHVGTATTSLNYTFIDIPEAFGVPSETNYILDSWSVFAFLESPILSAVVSKSVDAQVSYDKGGDIAMALYQVTDWDYWIDQFALGLSNNIRKTGNVTEENDMYPGYPGYVYFYVEFVQVRWVWLALPGTLLTMSIVLLVASIWQTRARNAKPWKSKALALLMCSADQEIQTAFRAGQDVEKMRVTLRYAGEKGIFSRSNKAD